MELSYSILLSVTAVLVFLFYRYLIAHYNYWKNRGVPSADGVVPGFGHLWPAFTMQKHLTIIQKEIYDAHTESMVGMFIMRRPILLIRDADLIKTVLQSEFNSFRHRQTVSKSESLICWNPFLLNDQEWKDSRSKLISLFTPKTLKIFSQVVQDAASEFVLYMNDQLEGKSFIELEGREMFEKITIEISGNAIFSLDKESSEKAMLKIFHKMMKSVLQPSFLQSLRTTAFQFIPFLNEIFGIGFVPNWINVKFASIVGDLLKKRRNGGVKRNDLLQNLIDISREEGVPDEVVISDTFFFFYDIFGTASIMLSFLACDLAPYPHIQKKLRDEINAVTSQYNGEISGEAVNKMTYLDQVVSESMRLHPVGVLHRICSEPIELRGPDGIKCRVQPGDQIVVLPYAIQRDPKHWKNPEEFRPERFDKRFVEFQGRHKYSYIPFGEGPRMCPQISVPVSQIKIIIATIVKNFVIEKSPKLREPVTLDPGFFLSCIKGGGWIRLSHLSS